MIENVVAFTGISKLDLDPSRVLDAAKEEGLDDVVIIGFDKNGNQYFASSLADGGDVLWHLERAKWRLMKMQDDLEAGE